MVWSYPPVAEHVGTRDFGTPGGWEGNMDGHRDDRGTAAVSQGTVPDLDLVEYVVISVPELSSAVGVAAALKQLVESAQIRILDLVGVVTDLDGRFTAVEPELLSGLAALDERRGRGGRAS